MSDASAPARVAVRGGGDEAVAAVDGAGLDHVADERQAAAVLVVGEDALLSIVDEDPAAPVVPVTANGGHHAVPRRRLAEALTALAAGRGHTVAHPVLSVTVGGEQAARALMDVSLVTSEPARISEFALTVDGERVDDVRADGVVIATPAGTDGYAGAAGGPVLAPGAGLSVVPIAPFETHSEHWVVPDAVTLSVERDEGDVTLVADDEAISEVPPQTPIRVHPAEQVTFYRLPETGPAE